MLGKRWLRGVSSMAPRRPCWRGRSPIASYCFWLIPEVMKCEKPPSPSGTPIATSASLTARSARLSSVSAMAATIRRVIETVDYHTGGEPFRIVVGGVEPLRGATVLEKRRDAAERLDWVRQLLVYEPRGHADMYGCHVVEPNDEGADLGVVFFHNAGYSTACGHGTIALVTWAIESGVVPGPRVVVDVPSGRLETWARVEDGKVRSVRFRNVPAFVWGRGLRAAGRVVDVAFGGAFYASCPERVEPGELPRLIELGRAIKRDLEAQHEIVHAEEPELRDIYGVIFWQEEGEPLTQRNVTVF